MRILRTWWGFYANGGIGTVTVAFTLLFIPFWVHEPPPMGFFVLVSVIISLTCFYLIVASGLRRWERWRLRRAAARRAFAADGNVRMSARDRKRLVKLLGLLGSPHGGEALAAARAAERLLRGAGVSWADVLQPAPR